MYTTLSEHLFPKNVIFYIDKMISMPLNQHTHTHTHTHTYLWQPKQPADLTLDDEDRDAITDPNDVGVDAKPDSNMGEQTSATHDTHTNTHTNTHTSIHTNTHTSSHTRATETSIMQLSPLGGGEDGQKVLRFVNLVIAKKSHQNVYFSISINIHIEI